MLPRSLLAAERGDRRRPRRWKRFVSGENDESVNPQFKAMTEQLEKIETYMEPVVGSKELPPAWDEVRDSMETICEFFKYLEEKGWWEDPETVPKVNPKNFFAELGGPEILLNLLRVTRRLHKDLGLMDLPEAKPPPQSLSEKEKKLYKTRARILDVEILCLSTLYRSCFSTFYVADRLSAQKSSISLLFETMRHKALFADSICVVEELLAVAEETFSLTEVEGFDDLVQSLSQSELASLCRALAMVVYEPEKNHVESLKIFKSSELLEMRKSLSGSSVKNTDKNHAVLLGSPNLLSRLVQLIGTKPTPPVDLELGLSPRVQNELVLQRVVPEIMFLRFEGTTTSELLEAIGMVVGEIITYESQEHHETPIAELLATVSGIEVVGTSTATNSEHGPNAAVNSELGPHDVAAAKHQVQVLFVVCSLLGSRRRADAQEALARCGLVPALVKLCKMLNWSAKIKLPSDQENPPHNLGCDCNPDSALKIQFLRLLHNFCDRDGDNRSIKRLLLSTTERRVVESNWDESKYQELKMSGWVGTDPNYYQGEAWDTTTPMDTNEELNIERDLEADKGLLRMILDILISQPAETSYRICLASCLEAYLRGAGKADQLLLAKGGLLRYLLGEVTGSAAGLGCTNSLQTSFDLLGELCKFNRDVFQLLEDELRDNDSLAGRLLTVATNNLVDSNVFIRSVILSMERFKVEDARRRTAGQDYEAFDFANCKLWSFLESNRMRLLYDLMSIIQLEDVNQENICCLNTSLVLFIFAQARDELREVLEQVREIHNEIDHQSVGTSRNFKELLGFWRDFYKHRGVDVLSLELSSNIPFDLWRQTVDALEEIL